jgi:quercetin dioxygenase-like cupin family protein
MKIQPLTSHEQKPVSIDGANGARMRMLIGPADGARNFHMRHFEVAPGGNTPQHAHDYEHEILVLAGRGTAMTTEGDRPFQAGDVIFVPANEMHAFHNTSEERCEFICLIPAPRDCGT